MSAQHAITKSENAAQNAQEPARIVIAENGEILYANTVLQSFLNRKKALKGHKFIDFFDIQDQEDAFRSSWIFSNQDDLSLNNPVSALTSGEHVITAKTTNKEARFQFDWITLDGKGSYLIGSTLEDDRSLSKTLKRVVKNTEKPSKQLLDQSLNAKDLQNFVDISLDVMLVSKPLGNLLKGNDTFFVHLQYSAQELEEMSFLDLVYDEDRPFVRASLQSLVKGERQTSVAAGFECRILSKDQRLFWFDWRQSFKNGLVYSVGRDITATKQHEDDLNRQHQKLLEAESIGQMGHWHWTLGQDEIHWSDEIYRIFGKDPDLFIPSLESLKSCVFREDVNRIMQSFQRAMIDKNDFEMDFRIIKSGVANHDSFFYVRCQGRCEIDAEGDVCALYGVMQDITQTTLHEHHLREAKDSAERAYAAKSQFLANMSHELRTPLNAIIGFSEMMESQLLGPIGTEKYLEYVSGIRESGVHLLDLISDILDMSKIEAGKYTLTMEKVNIAKLLQLSANMMEGRALDSDIQITKDIQNEDLTIWADRRAVLQMILNLLSNAVKFSHKGGKVELSLQERDNYLILKVRDEGIGIPANKLPAIVRPFEQAASHYTREHEGSGLGLAITKDLAELHGGHIHIESAVDVGTTVTIRLPYDARKFQKTD